MPVRKKTFACGHKGFGQKCHRCVQIVAPEKITQTLTEKQQQKMDWQAAFEQDPINLRNLPAHVVSKARIVIAQLQNKRDYREFGGKRLRHNRLIISIPITRNYRMLCRDCGTSLVPQAVLSHENYNVCKPG